MISVFAPKTGKMREVPLSGDAFEVLHAWWVGKKSEFVFYNSETGQPFVYLRNGLLLACRKAGVSGVSWHTLRHTFASRLLHRGVDIATGKELLGHHDYCHDALRTHQPGRKASSGGRLERP